MKERKAIQKAGCLSCSEANLSRRDFLRVGSLSVLGVHLSQYLSLQHQLMAAAGADRNKIDRKGKAESCILLWLEGGPSQIDTWDPKPNSSFRPISTNVPGIQISELLPKVAQHMDKLALVRSMFSEENDHPQGTYYAITGHRPNPAMRFPSLGSIITRELGPRGDVPPHVLVPRWERQRYDEYFKSSFAGAENDPMLIADPNQKDFQVADLRLPKSIPLERLEHRRSLQDMVEGYYRRQMELAETSEMDVFTEKAQSMILSPAVRDAFDLTQETDKMRDTYGRTSFGQSVLLARRLVEAGSRFVTASGFEFNSWDTHLHNDRNHRDKLTPVLDQTLAALLEDLDQRGLLESTLVVVMGEFGRTAIHNPNGGRDHWSYCWSMAMGGGGLRGGQVVGASDEKGAYLAEGKQTTIGDLFATIYKAMGIDWHTEYMSPIGRPVKIANSLEDKTGEPIAELI